MIYKIRITETLEKDFEVEAKTEDEALFRIEEEYDSCDIVLDADDFVEKTIRVVDSYEREWFDWN